jgi:quercetin dioxygenase-like cupin family protein
MKHFIDLKTLEVKDNLPGAMAAYYQTEYFTVAFTEMQTGAEIPLHNHLQEAVDIILEGELEMQINSNTNILKPGMLSHVSSNAMPKAKAITNCKTITILYPKREI